MSRPWSSGRLARTMTGAPSRAGGPRPRRLPSAASLAGHTSARRTGVRRRRRGTWKDPRLLQPERREPREGRIAGGLGEAAAALSRAGRRARPPRHRSRAARARASGDAAARCDTPCRPGEHGDRRACDHRRRQERARASVLRTLRLSCLRWRAAPSLPPPRELREARAAAQSPITCSVSLRAAAARSASRVASGKPSRPASSR